MILICVVLSNLIKWDDIAGVSDSDGGKILSLTDYIATYFKVDIVDIE